VANCHPRKQATKPQTASAAGHSNPRVRFRMRKSAKRASPPRPSFPPTPPPVAVEPVVVTTGPVRVLSKPDVLEKVGGVGWITLRSWIIAGGFPPARQLGPGHGRSHTGWLSHEVDAWLLNAPKRLPKGAKR
jgi:predicted DNA-binding transcriptional regulator AlpA